MARSNLSPYVVFTAAVHASLLVSSTAFQPVPFQQVVNVRDQRHQQNDIQRGYRHQQMHNRRRCPLPGLVSLQSLPDTTPLFQIEDLEDHSQSSEPNAFYDVDYEDDDEIDYSLPEYGDFVRDEDDLLTEREDRLYLNEDGTERQFEKCILVGVENLSAKRKSNKREESRNAEEWEVYFTLEESLVEMKELIKTAGMLCVGEMTQRLQDVNPKTYIGTGKIQEVKDLIEEHDCMTVVFDAELSPGQQKALENSFNKKLIQNDFAGESEIKVLDRTALILDIFAQHAKTREGKLQVDLALHEYRKPRLTRMWTHLERQSGAGGVGLRGPGESQLEIDKRLVRDRIIVLKKKIDEVQKQRSIRRQGRSRTGLPILSLVGYTNAGKSTMLNYLTRAGVMAESMLFATLDPTTRKVKLPGYKTHPEVLLTDTVGFIQKLPTQLVAAFRATLEEVQEADVLIHVVDVSNPCWVKQERAVRSVLADIDAIDKPIVTVFNKVDLIDPLEADYLRNEAASHENQVAVSSITGDGMPDFVAVVEDALMDLLVPIEVVMPYSKGDEVNMIHEMGNVEIVDYREEGTYILGRVPGSLANRVERFSVHAQGKTDVKTQKKKRKQVASEHDETGSFFDDEHMERSKSRKEDEDDIDWTAIGRGRHKAKKTDTF